MLGVNELAALKELHPAVAVTVVVCTALFLSLAAYLLYRLFGGE